MTVVPPPMPALVLAAFFVGGCAAIHILRRQADRMTAGLATVALCLGAILTLVTISKRQAATASDAVDPPACYGFE